VQAFVPLTLALDEAFQFDLSEEDLLVGGIHQRMQVSHLKLCDNDALRLLLNHVGLSCDNAGLSIDIDSNALAAKAALETVADLEGNDLASLLANVENMPREKWDWSRPSPLRMKLFASISLDIATAIGFAKNAKWCSK
jgi:hypothetical protein